MADSSRHCLGCPYMAGAGGLEVLEEAEGLEEPEGLAGQEGQEGQEGLEGLEGVNPMVVAGVDGYSWEAG